MVRYLGETPNYNLDTLLRLALQNHANNEGLSERAPNYGLYKYMSLLIMFSKLSISFTSLTTQLSTLYQYEVSPHPSRRPRPSLLHGSLRYYCCA